MNPVKIVALALIALGILGLVYDRFSYTEATHEVNLGPIEFEVKEKKTVNVPVWAGVISIVVGAGLLVVPLKKM
ncbi:MAG TPA: hypothetical protein PLJ47_06650 [Candidatus Hydrogenedentes bacterium]|nr:hypothetical protein [Candidatus Hydrogenedentota bacterium]HRK34257.1 hypothetical protein [Candidatus Hydrogenedentota bacterium]